MGQIYVPQVNWALMVATVLIVIGFGSSGAVAAAYGIAVAVIVKVNIDVTSHTEPFLDAVCPPVQVIFGIGAGIQVVRVWAMQSYVDKVGRSS